MLKKIIFIIVFILTLFYPKNTNAQSFTGTSGFSFALFQAGLTSQAALTPHIEVGLLFDNGISLSGRNSIMLMPPFNNGQQFGINNKTLVQVGISTENVSWIIGFSLSSYSIVVCGVQLCGRVNGISPGGDIVFDWYPSYFLGNLGVRANAGFSLFTGRSLVLSDVISTNFLIGPILRFGSKK